MKTSAKYYCLLLAVAALLFTGTATGQSPKLTSFNTSPPSRFTENKGQITDQRGHPRPDVKYIYSAPGLKVIFKENSFSYELYTIESQPEVSEATGRPVNLHRPDRSKEPSPITISTHRIDVTMPKAVLHPKIIAEGKSSDYTNYYLAHTQEEGIQNVYGYSRLIYKDIIPKVDLIFCAEKEGELSYKIILRPGARLEDVKFLYMGITGMIFPEGRFILESSLSNESIQILGKDGMGVAEMHCRTPSLEVALRQKNAGQPEVVEHKVLWATYYGGSKYDWGSDLTTDSFANVYVTGITESINNIATEGYHQSTYSAEKDVFVAKFNSSGKRIWGTYYGGNQDDYSDGIAISKSGTIVITGTTLSSDGISTSGTHQSKFGGNRDAFITKFNNSGIRLWATYFGGELWDNASDIAIDPQDNILITGSTFNDNNIATKGTHKSTKAKVRIRSFEDNFEHDAFLVKFNNSGLRLWATYFGGNGIDNAEGITVDTSGNILIIGETFSTSGIATAKAHQTEIRGRNYSDAFVAKFNPRGNLIWATYYGGTMNDQGKGIAVDPQNNIYFIGWTWSPNNIATAGANQSKYSEGYGGDVFVVKLNSSGIRQWATYYGGNDRDRPMDIATDSSGHVFITGESSRAVEIDTTRRNLVDDVKKTSDDVFVAKFSSSGDLLWEAFFGGTNGDRGDGIAIDVFGNLIITGGTDSSIGIPTEGVHQVSYGGGPFDGFVVKFSARHIRPMVFNTSANMPSNDRTKSDSALVATTSPQAPFKKEGNVLVVDFDKDTTDVSPQSNVNIYSNPFSEKIIVHFSLGQSGPVRLELLDMAGNIITSQEQENQPAGAHSITLSIAGKRLAPAVYLLRLQTGNQSMLRRVVKARE